MKNLLLIFHILLIFSIVGCVAKPKGVYVGEKKDGERHGQGTVTYADGKKYVGQFENGRKHGEGTQTWSNGKKYVGEWNKGKRTGSGVMTNRDGSKFDGEWKRDRPYNGKGVIQEKQDRKEGEWINGKMEGYGKMSDSNTKVWYKSYEGEFKKGRFHGQGKMSAKKILTDDMARSTGLAKLRGLIFKGEFKNGRPWNLESFNENGEQQSLRFNAGNITGHK